MCVRAFKTPFDRLKHPAGNNPDAEKPPVARRPGVPPAREFPPLPGLPWGTLRGRETSKEGLKLERFDVFQSMNQFYCFHDFRNLLPSDQINE